MSVAPSTGPGRPGTRPPAQTVRLDLAHSVDSVEPDANGQPLTAAEHDLIVRYCLVGIVVMLGTAALWAARVIALPLATGVVFGMVLGPIVDYLVVRRVPQQAAAALIVLVGVLLLGTLMVLLALPLSSWLDQLPAMVTALQTKFAGAFQMLRSLLPIGGLVPPPGAAPHPSPIMDIAKQLPLIDIALGSSTAAADLLVFVATVYFYLATRRHIKAQILRLCLGREARKSAGHFFENIEERVATYLGLVTAINLVCGTLAALIAWGAGLSYPLLWGTVACVLNYLPFVGPLMTIGLIFAAGLLAAPTLWGAAWPAGAYLMVHLLESNVVTPELVGKRMTMSPFLVFVSFVFWLWLWGPVGAVLATPILLIGMVGFDAVREYREATAEPEPEGEATAPAPSPQLPAAQVRTA